MKYRIKHENLFLQVTGILLTFLTFILLAVNMHSVTLFWAMIVSLALTVITAVLCIIDKIAGASIVIRDDTVTVTRLFGRKRIKAGDIASVSIEDITRYRRKPEPHYEYRKKMTMLLVSGKKTVLTDNASEINGLIGFVTGQRDMKQDDDIPLFQAYLEILKLTAEP